MGRRGLAVHLRSAAATSATCLHAAVLYMPDQSIHWCCVLRKSGGIRLHTGRANGSDVGLRSTAASAGPNEWWEQWNNADG
jgi:hypothetical protein